MYFQRLMMIWIGVGIELFFAEMKDPAKERLKRYGLFTKLGSNHFFPHNREGG